MPWSGTSGSISSGVGTETLLPPEFHVFPITPVGSGGDSTLECTCGHCAVRSGSSETSWWPFIAAVMKMCCPAVCVECSLFPCFLLLLPPPVLLSTPLFCAFPFSSLYGPVFAFSLLWTPDTLCPPTAEARQDHWVSHRPCSPGFTVQPRWPPCTPWLGQMQSPRLLMPLPLPFHLLGVLLWILKWLESSCYPGST